MIFSAKAKVCGILANPVEHSLSPLMQNAFARYYKKDFVYVPLHVKENLSAAVKGAFAMNFCGMNVTIPYKVEVMDLLWEVDETARKIGAVNTLVKTDFGYKGYNTDMDGLKCSLKERNISLENRHVLVLGAGGVSKAVLFLAMQEGASGITLANRNVEKAKNILHEMWMEGNVISLDELNRNPLSALPYENYIAFQCTGIGMHPNASECILSNPDVYDKIDVGVDMIYTPMKTMFLKECESRGKTAINGLDMLIYQGLIAFHHWNPDIEPDEKAVETARELLTKTLQTD